MKTINKHKLTLNRETLQTLEPKALAEVNGGAAAAAGAFNSYICVSNVGGGHSCLSYCPGK